MLLAAGPLPFSDEPAATLLALTYSLSKCSLNTYHMPRLFLVTWDRAGDILVFMVMNFQVREIDNKLIRCLHLVLHSGKEFRSRMRKRDKWSGSLCVSQGNRCVVKGNRWNLYSENTEGLID